jgi:tripartite-type tricarboxylate transporter receptor subunit TctC
VIAKINAETNKALQMPEVSEKLVAQGAEIVGGTPEAFGTFLKSELAKWKKVADGAKVKLD